MTFQPISGLVQKSECIPQSMNYVCCVCLMFVSLFSLNERNSEQIEVSVLRKQTPMAFPGCEGCDKWGAGEKNPGRQCGRNEEGKKEGGRERRREEGKKDKEKKKKKEGRGGHIPFCSISVHLYARSWCPLQTSPPGRPGYFLSAWL